MRENLDKIKPIVAFEKKGINSWAHQDRVPTYSAQEVEEILGRELDSEMYLVETSSSLPDGTR